MRERDKEITLYFAVGDRALGEGDRDICKGYKSTEI